MRSTDTKSDHNRLVQCGTEIPPRCARPPLRKGAFGFPPLTFASFGRGLMPPLPQFTEGNKFGETFLCISFCLAVYSLSRFLIGYSQISLREMIYGRNSATIFLNY